MKPRSFITVVSGAPRSGTSMMMQMLHAGGMAVLTDHVRLPDEDNPRGYFELERARLIGHDGHCDREISWLSQARGRAVKIVHMHLRHLPSWGVPSRGAFRVIFMVRDLDEIARSQAIMHDRRRCHHADSMADPAPTHQELVERCARQLARARQEMALRPNVRMLDVPYSGIIADPVAHARAIETFLGGGVGSGLGSGLNVAAMAAAVDPALYRNRATRGGNDA